MNENMKRQVILLEREKKAIIIFNWDIFRMHPLLQTPLPPPPQTPQPSKI